MFSYSMFSYSTATTARWNSKLGGVFFSLTCKISGELQLTHGLKKYDTEDNESPEFRSAVRPGTCSAGAPPRRGVRLSAPETLWCGDSSVTAM